MQVNMIPTVSPLYPHCIPTVPPAARFPPSVSSLPLLIQDVFSNLHPTRPHISPRTLKDPPVQIPPHPIGPIAFGQLSFPFQAARVAEHTAAYHCDDPTQQHNRVRTQEQEACYSNQLQSQPSSVGSSPVSP